MHPIIYDVSVSLDGFICGPDGDISLFDHGGVVVDYYMARLGDCRVAIMGRRTYEFGYSYGLEPGANPYPQMRCIVVSERLKLPQHSGVEVTPRMSCEDAFTLKAKAGGPIYLCGGGAFAAAMLKMGCIDRLRLKRAPIVLGSGVPLFEGDVPAQRFTCAETRHYPGGYVYQDFEIN